MKTKDLVFIALFAALTAVGGFLNIPTPFVPFSLQFLFCAYAGVLLGSRNALLSQLLYLAIGLIGVPVFTKGGGIGYILQPSFGFLLGFAACAFLIGLIVEREPKPGFGRIFIAVLSGLLSTYIIGALYLYFITNYLAAPDSKIDIAQAIAWGVTPFIAFDLIKAVIVSATSLKILPALRRAL
ncbi:MAG: biotin transporter BioY [Caldicoprobacterales bacterium]|nr:biotin transporter BioY [Clostridiales bacterium]